MRRFRHVILWSSYVLLVALFAHPVHAERRVAMVIGNGAYRHTSTLPNASIDAKAMAALLRNVGFDVAEWIDLKRDEMMTRLSEFATKIQGADVALLYTRGTALQWTARTTWCRSTSTLIPSLISSSVQQSTL